MPENLERTKQLWRFPLPNQGIGGISVFEDFVIVSSRDRNDQMDLFACLDAATGVAYWQHTYACKGDLDYGNSPRATPLVVDPYVILLGAFGHIHCLDMETGEVIWAKHMIDDLDGKLPQWGYSASPIAVDGKLILQPGGEKMSIVALDLESGDLLWSSPGRAAAYASLILAEVDGKKQVIGFDEKSLGGWDVETGKRLWEVVPAEKNDFNVPTPVMIPNGIALVSENNSTRIHHFEAGILQDKVVADFQDMRGDSHTPIVVNDRLIGIDGQLYALDFKNGLAEKGTFATPSLNDYCSVIGSEDRVLITTLSGEIILVRVEEAGLTEIGRFKISDKSAQILAHPALANRTLFVRLPDAIEAWQLAPSDDGVE